MKLTNEQLATAICGKVLSRMKLSRETCLHIIPLGGRASYFNVWSICMIIIAPYFGGIFIAPSMYSFKIFEGGFFVMKNKRIIALLLLCALMLAAILTGCATTNEIAHKGTSDKAQTTQTTPKPTLETTPEIKDNAIIVTDMAGREIKLDEPATQVIALFPSDCEILYAIGAGETLVGRGEYCDYPQDVFDVPVVQSGANTNIEQIINLNPQVLLMSTMDQTEEQVAALEAAGIKVVVSKETDIEGVYTAISMIGTLMDKKTEAETIINSMKEAFSEVALKSVGKEEKTIYFEVSPLEYGLWTAGRGTFMNEIAEILGLKNCFDDINGWGAISEEQVIERNPDYIVTITMYFGEGPRPEDEIMNRAGWESVTAVKNGAILNFQNNELSRPIPRLADGAKILYDFVYDSDELGVK